MNPKLQQLYEESLDFAQGKTVPNDYRERMSSLSAEERKEIRDAIRNSSTFKLAEDDRTARRQAFMAQFENATPAQKQAAFELVLQRIQRALSHTSDPEEIPSADQDRIDAVAGELLRDIDI